METLLPSLQPHFSQHQAQSFLFDCLEYFPQGVAVFPDDVADWGRGAGSSLYSRFPLPRLPMQVVIVGTGKLARELLASHQLGHPFQVVPWGRQAEDEPAIVVHAGSGRELP